MYVEDEYIWYSYISSYVTLFGNITLDIGTATVHVCHMNHMGICGVYQHMLGTCPAVVPPWIGLWLIKMRSIKYVMPFLTYLCSEYWLQFLKFPHFVLLTRSQGCWRKITVDDSMPFDEENNLLLPASTRLSELWPMLLAKALIKVANTKWVTIQSSRISRSISF